MVALTDTRSPERGAAVPLAPGSPPKPSGQPSGLFGGLARSLTIRPRSNSKRQNSLRRGTGGRLGHSNEAASDSQRSSNERNQSGEEGGAVSVDERARSPAPVAFVPTTTFSGSGPQESPRGMVSRTRGIALQSTEHSDAAATAFAVPIQGSHTLTLVTALPSDPNSSKPRRQGSTTSRAVSGRAGERLEWGEPPRNANAALRDEAIGVNSPPSDGWAGPRHQRPRHQRASSETGQGSQGPNQPSQQVQPGSHDLARTSSQGTVAGSTSLVSRLSLRRRTSRKSPPRSGAGGGGSPRVVPQDLLEADEPPSQAPSPSVIHAPRWGRRSFDSLTSPVELRDDPPAYSAAFGTTSLDHGNGVPAIGPSQRVHAPGTSTESSGPALPGTTDLRRARTQHRSVTFAGTPPVAAPRRGHNVGAGARQSWASSYDGRVDVDPFDDHSLDSVVHLGADALDRTSSGRLRPVISSTARAKPVREGSTLPAMPAYPSGYWAPPSDGARLTSSSSWGAGSATHSPSTGGSSRAGRTNAAGEGMMDAREYMRVRDELMKSAGPFFAVRRGWKKGVYISKDEADKQTRGFPGPQMSEFATADEALEWLASTDAPVPSSSGLIIAGTSSPSTTSLTSLASPGDQTSVAPGSNAEAGSGTARPGSPDSPFGLLAERATVAAAAGTAASGASRAAMPAITTSFPSVADTSRALSSPSSSPLPPAPPPKTKIVDWEQFDDSASLMGSAASPRVSMLPSPLPANQSSSLVSNPAVVPGIEAAPSSVETPVVLPSEPTPTPPLLLSGCGALLSVSDLETSVSFYTTIFGAVVVDRQGDAQTRLRVGQAQAGADIWLRAVAPGGPTRAPSSTLWTLKDVTTRALGDVREAFVHRMASSALRGKAHASIGTLEQMPWGTSEFSITDLDGNTLVLTTPLD